MMVYIASDHELPLIEWNEDAPAFHVRELHEKEKAVRAQFTLPHIYYVGAHEGCGCGFQVGEYPDNEGDGDMKNESFWFREKQPLIVWT